MSTLELPSRAQEILNRVAAVSPGPWTWDATSCIPCGPGSDRFTQILRHPGGPVLFHDAYWAINPDDAAFLANALDDVQWLLGRLLGSYENLEALASVRAECAEEQRLRLQAEESERDALARADRAERQLRLLAEDSARLAGYWRGKDRADLAACYEDVYQRLDLVRQRGGMP